MNLKEIQQITDDLAAALTRFRDVTGLDAHVVIGEPQPGMTLRDVAITFPDALDEEAEA